MSKVTKKNLAEIAASSGNSSTSLPTPKKGDVYEAAEMVRASLAVLRQSFGIVYMSNAIGASHVSDAEQKKFVGVFDALEQYLRDTYTDLVKFAETLSE